MISWYVQGIILKPFNIEFWLVYSLNRFLAFTLNKKLKTKKYIQTTHKTKENRLPKTAAGLNCRKFGYIYNTEGRDHQVLVL